MVPGSLTTPLTCTPTAESSLCLWTEWFDQDTPCNSRGDSELHSQHFHSLQQSWSGSARICRPEEMGPGQPTQYEAGSELTLVTTEGLARGVPLKQTIHVGIGIISMIISSHHL